MSEKNQPKRWRCLTSGCNPVLNEKTAAEHNATTQHRVAKWPVRSPAGKKKAAQRNKTGYYDKYNVGDKSYLARVEDGYMADNHSLLKNYYDPNYGVFVSFEAGLDGHGQN
jgi:hypothetical protein